jgi:hypothetical protein
MLGLLSRWIGRGGPVQGERNERRVPEEVEENGESDNSENEGGSSDEDSAADANAVQDEIDSPSNSDDVYDEFYFEVEDGDGIVAGGCGGGVGVGEGEGEGEDEDRSGEGDDENYDVIDDDLEAMEDNFMADLEGTNNPLDQVPEMVLLNLIDSIGKMDELLEDGREEELANFVVALDRCWKMVERKFPYHSRMSRSFSEERNGTCCGHRFASS